MLQALNRVCSVLFMFLMLCVWHEKLYFASLSVSDGISSLPILSQVACSINLIKQEPSHATGVQPPFCCKMTLKECVPGC